MGNTFGDRLKHERISRRLTQSELGGGLYSASYISLLENGRREPTAEIIAQLSRQLELAPASLEDWAHPVSAANNECLVTSLYARQCWDTRDYDSAAKYADSAAVKANELRDSVTWWNMTYLQANSYLRSGRSQEAFDVLERLVDHPMTIASTALALRAHQLMAAALLGLGHLPEAVERATIAVDLGAGNSQEEYTAYLTALQTLIGALTESGRLDEAWARCLTLADAITDDTPVQMAGEMHWVIGNVAFIRHDISGGLDHHGKAGALLSPALDLSRWAQFNMATAWVRLSAGIIQPATLEAIERSELAHSIVGATPVEEAEMTLLRARWHYQLGENNKALKLLSTLDPEREDLASFISGDISLLLGRVLHAEHRDSEAITAYEHALEYALRAGAVERTREAERAIDEIRALSGNR